MVTSKVVVVVVRDGWKPLLLLLLGRCRDYSRLQLLGLLLGQIGPAPGGMRSRSNLKGVVGVRVGGGRVAADSLGCREWWLGLWGSAIVLVGRLLVLRIASLVFVHLVLFVGG